MALRRSLETRALNPKEARFVEEFIVHLNPRKAALAAGYSSSMASSKAYQWVSDGKVKPHVYKAVMLARAERSKRAQITQDDVVEQLGKIAFFDIRRAFTETGVLKSFSEMDDETTFALASVENFEIKNQDGEVIGVTRKIKFHDRLRAIELLMRHMGLLHDKLRVSGDADNPLTMLIRSVQGSAIKPALRHGAD
jgi:phage terminase small subunit